MTPPTEEKTETKPRRRLLRLSVRASMVAVLLAAVALGYVVHRARVQRQAVAAIERAGGRAVYEWERLPNGNLNPNGRPRGPRWLVDLLGVDYFGSVVIVSLGEKATDAEMEHVGRLARLQGMTSGGSKQVTDAGAARLRGLVDLDHINLSFNKVTGACLADFRGLSKLKDLHLVGVPVADADLANLEGLTNLEILDLSSTRVTDAGLVHLEPLVKLKQLRLNSTRIAGPGLAHLKGMTSLGWLQLVRSQVEDLSTVPRLPQLAWLNLNDTPIGDRGLAGLVEFKSLPRLYLAGTKITDAGLAHLEGMDRLTDLMLSRTKVTAAGAPALARLKGLTRLYLEETGMTDEGLAELARSPSLAQLGLGKTKVTDAGLDHLAGLKTLKILDVAGSAATDAGVAHLRKALPGLMSSQEAAARRRAQTSPARPPGNPAPKP